MAESGEKLEQAFGSQPPTGKPLISKMRPTGRNVMTAVFHREIRSS